MLHTQNRKKGYLVFDQDASLFIHGNVVNDELPALKRQRKLATSLVSCNWQKSIFYSSIQVGPPDNSEATIIVCLINITVHKTRSKSLMTLYKWIVAWYHSILRGYVCKEWIQEPQQQNKAFNSRTKWATNLILYRWKCNNELWWNHNKVVHSLKQTHKTMKTSGSQQCKPKEQCVKCTRI
jgi:hypothetical protein